MENRSERNESEKVYAHSYESLVRELSKNMTVNEEMLFQNDESKAIKDSESIFSWIEAVDFADGKTPAIEASFSSDGGKNLVRVDAEKQTAVKSLEEKASKEDLLYSMALTEAKMKVISSVAEDVYPAIAFQIADYRKEMEKMRDEILGNKKESISLDEIMHGVISRRKFMAIAIIGSMVLAACGVGTETKTTPVINTSTPAMTETYTPPAATATEIPTVTATEAPTPTEEKRYTELIPASKELCKTENVIRFNNYDKDWADFRSKEDTLVSTLNITSGVEVSHTQNNSGTESTVTTNMLEFKSKIISCSFVELNEQGEGVYVFGIPYLSNYDNKVHIYHAAIDWDNFDKIISYEYGPSNVQRGNEHLDYSFITSQKYNDILASYIMFYGNGDANQPFLNNLFKIYTISKMDLSAKIENSNFKTDYPNYIKEVNDDIFPCDYIWFE